MIASKNSQEKISLEENFEQLDILYELYDLSRIIKCSKTSIRKERKLDASSTEDDLKYYDGMLLILEESKNELKAKLRPKFDFFTLTLELNKLEKHLSQNRIHAVEIEKRLAEVRENLEEIKLSGYYYLRILSIKALSLMSHQDHKKELKKRKKIQKYSFNLDLELETQLDLILEKIQFLSSIIRKDENNLNFEDE